MQEVKTQDVIVGLSKLTRVECRYFISATTDEVVNAIAIHFGIEYDINGRIDIGKILDSIITYPTPPPEYPEK